MGLTDGGAAFPKDGPNDESCIPVELKEDGLIGGAKAPDEDAGTDNPESKDSREFGAGAGAGAGVLVFTLGRESKFAQSLLLDVASGTEDASAATCVCWTVTVGGSGTASKSINETSTFTSDGLASVDAKLLEDAVL